PLVGASLCFVQRSHAEVTTSQAESGSPASSAENNLAMQTLSNISLGFGGSDESGDFGAAKTTNIASTLATVTYRADNLRLTASVPWMRIDSPGAVFTGIEGSPIIANPSTTGGKTLREGLGDLTVGASYLLPATLIQGLDTDLSVRVKIPTATQSSRLSTGEVDYSVGATVSKTIGRYSPLVSIFYRSFGNGPNFQLKNGFATSIGTTYAFSPRIVGLLTYDYAQRASQYIADGHQITTSVTSLLPNSPVRVTAFISGGLSRGAPGISTGISLSLRL
ncbi:MAG: transporter, partial [Caulobacteraceae bacterium]